MCSLETMVSWGWKRVILLPIKNNLVSRPASVWGKYKQEAVTNTVAVVADSVKKHILYTQMVQK